MSNVFKVVAVAVFCLLFSGGIVLAQTQSDPEKLAIPTSRSYWLVKSKEWVKTNLLTFKKASKAKIYNGYTDRRLSEVQYAASVKDNTAANISLNRFKAQKEKALMLAEKAGDDNVLNIIKNQTLEQQRAMTELQLGLDSDKELQENIVKVQKTVATQSKNVIEVVEGKNEAVTYDQQTWVVWRDPNADVNGNLPALPDTLEYAPGTSAGGTGGTVYAGGAGQIWAPGTTAGGTATNTTSGTVIEGGQSGTATNSTSGNVVSGGQETTTQGGTTSGQVVE